MKAIASLKGSVVVYARPPAGESIGRILNMAAHDLWPEMSPTVDAMARKEMERRAKRDVRA